MPVTHSTTGIVNLFILFRNTPASYLQALFEIPATSVHNDSPVVCSQIYVFYSSVDNFQWKNNQFSVSFVYTGFIMMYKGPKSLLRLLHVFLWILAK